MTGKTELKEQTSGFQLLTLRKEPNPNKYFPLSFWRAVSLYRAFYLGFLKPHFG